MARYQSPHRPSRRAGNRSSSRLLLAVLTASMLATGGFGALPDNPVTRAVQEQISGSFSEPFLNPINSYLEQISIPAIESRPHPNPSLDIVGWLFPGNPSETPGVSTPASTMTPTAVDTPLVTDSPTATPGLTSTLTPTATATPTTTPVCSRPSTTPAMTTFFNGSALTIDVYLVDPACNLTLYFTLGPEQSMIQETFIGQLWWFIDPSVGRLLSDYLVSSANEAVDVSTGAVTIVTPTPASPGGFIVSNVDLTDDLYQFGTSITLAPGQEFYVTYDFQIFSGSCPTCSAQLITGLGVSGKGGDTCAYDNVPGIPPGASGFEFATLYAPDSSGTYAVVVEYHQRASCSDALTNFGTGEAISTQVIGQIIVQ